MPKKKKKHPILKFFEGVSQVVREVDGSVQTLTGKRLQDFLNEVNDEYLLNQDEYIRQEEKVRHVRDNYGILGVTPTTPPEDVKKTYLLLVKIYHEAGTAPNPERMRDINNAYDEICKERGWPK